MKRFLVIATLLFAGIWPPAGAKAQAPAPEVIAGTVSISTDVRAALEAFLESSPPSAAPFYAPTYSSDRGTFTYVSLAALDIPSAESAWSLETREGEARTVIWTGTFKVWSGGSVDLVSASAHFAAGPKLAAPLLGPGGGVTIYLPFEPFKVMQYGPRLIHGSGDYGTSGMYAVDLVGGNALGSNVASDVIYASAAGTIEYVCNDDTSVAVRTHDDTGDDTFVYAHLLDNASLEMDHAFTTGEAIGSLKHGGFDDTCGWAEQSPQTYHVHWMFEPSGGAYAVGGYTILLSDKKFHKGNSAVGSGGWISNQAAPPGGVDDPPPAGGAVGPSIWDNVVGTIAAVVQGTAALLPAHNSLSIILRGTLNTIVLFFRLAWILLRGRLNLVPLAFIATFLIGIRVPFAVTWLIFWAIRAFRVIKQAFSPLG